MIDIRVLIAIALASYRVSRMISEEEGPWEAFTRLRGMVFRRAPNAWIERGVNCPLCLSFWICIILTAVSRLPFASYGIMALAASGVASLLFIIFEGRR